MRVLPGLLDVIGRPASHDGILFIPVLGRFRYSLPRFFLHEHADLRFLDDLMDEEMYRNNALWVRARLIKLFGIDHPTGHGMMTLLNFQLAAFEWKNAAKAAPKHLFPMLISDTWRGAIDDYGHSPDASVVFPRGVDMKTRSRIASCLWSLLLSEPTALGIFCDYWYSEYDGSVDRISCDGHRLQQDFLGHLHPEPCEDGDEECHDTWWPFTFPRKRRVIRGRAFPRRPRTAGTSRSPLT